MGRNMSARKMRRSKGLRIIRNTKRKMIKRTDEIEDHQPLRKGSRTKRRRAILATSRRKIDEK